MPPTHPETLSQCAASVHWFYEPEHHMSGDPSCEELEMERSQILESIHRSYEVALGRLAFVRGPSCFRASLMPRTLICLRPP
uniref:Uncharacterized protein n=2 Tax=Oryza sativa subsp. japonica TaxID=39947 RepID=Q7G6F5_ORYSJ|nr:hypothetical protein [Oryza sativa Japonica Group]AAM44881.1 Hypothetical protein [Oryza sativa Japonica Group]AAP53596.1 hypothetical protein LOC_Os10g25580 [Oryza sativa Japonica Group]